MIFLGVRVTTNKDEKSGKEYVRKRGYFGRNISDKEGRGVIPTYFADFNQSIDVDSLKIGQDYCVETYDVQRTNKDTGEVYTFKYISNIK